MGVAATDPKHERFAPARTSAPEASALVLLSLEQDQVHLLAQSTPSAPGVSARLSLGYGNLAAACFSRWPPAPVELERAIDLVEDELALVRWPVAQAILTVDEGRSGPLLGRWATELGGHLPLCRDDVESAFQELAAGSLISLDGRLSSVRSRHEAAVLVLVRELMHHWDFVKVILPRVAA